MIRRERLPAVFCLWVWLLFSIFCGSLPLFSGCNAATEMVMIRREAATSFSAQKKQSNSNNSNETQLEDDDGEEDQEPARCHYDGQVVFSHPTSVGVKDRLYFIGSHMLKAAHITIDKINAFPRCGLKLKSDDDQEQERHYSLVLQTYGDESSKDVTTEIANGLVTDGITDFLLSGYTSGLTGKFTPVASENGRVVVTGGSSRVSAHADMPTVFGNMGPTHGRYRPVFDGLRSRGGSNFVYFAQEEVNDDGVEEMAQEAGFDLLAPRYEIAINATLEDYQEMARAFAALDPDVVICITRDQQDKWIQALRNIDYTPKALVFTPISGQELVDALGSDVAYQMGISLWDSSLPPIPDSVTGWTPNDFNSLFEEAAFRPPTHHPVSQSSAISVLVQAIERVGVYRPNYDVLRHANGTVIVNEWQALVAKELAIGHFATVFGNVSFDENGQNTAPPLLIQYDHNETVHVQQPTELKTTNTKMVYPMPTWKNRDCKLQSDCESDHDKFGGGICTSEGFCDCPEPSLSNGEVGSDAGCEPDLAVVDATANLIHVVAIPVAAVVVVAALLFLNMQRIQRKNDAVWMVQKDELVLEDPPIVLGHGSFGQVLLGEFRGTQVAVKRVLPSSSPRSSSPGEDGGINKSTEDPQRQKVTFASGLMSGRASGKVSDSSAARKSQIKSKSYFTSTVRNTLKQDFIREMRYVSKLRHPWYVTIQIDQL